MTEPDRQELLGWCRYWYRTGAMGSGYWQEFLTWLGEDPLECARAWGEERLVEVLREREGE